MKKSVTAAIVAVTGLLVAGAAHADVDLFNVNQQQLDASINMRRSTTEQADPIRGQAISERARPDYDPVPVPVGSFQLFPALNLGSYYDSNIFAVRNGEIDDVIWKINPTMTLSSNWGRHALVFTGFGDFNYYSNNNEQVYHAGAIQAEGRYDIAEQTWLSGLTSYQRAAEMRGGLNAPGNSVGPSEYNLYTAAAGAYRGVGKLKAAADYKFAYYDYTSIDLIGGGVASQNERDRTQNDITGSLGYEVTRNLRPYVKGGYNWVNYTRGGENTSDGYNMDVGAKADLGGLVTADVYMGYLSRDFVNVNNGTTIDALDFGADILWNVTTLTSIAGKARRSIEQTTDVASPGVLASQGSIMITHELRRNLLIEGNVTYYSLDYLKSPRLDHLYGAGTGMRYFMNRHIFGDLTYDLEHRTSENTTGVGYNRHIAFLRVGVQY
ncbi:MAG: outer membrane beta-barrel protein [Bdellovibrionales bacterium]